MKEQLEESKKWTLENQKIANTSEQSLTETKRLINEQVQDIKMRRRLSQAEFNQELSADYFCLRKIDEHEMYFEISISYFGKNFTTIDSFITKIDIVPNGTTRTSEYWKDPMSKLLPDLEYSRLINTKLTPDETKTIRASYHKLDNQLLDSLIDRQKSILILADVFYRDQSSGLVKCYNFSAVGIIVDNNLECKVEFNKLSETNYTFIKGRKRKLFFQYNDN